MLYRLEEPIYFYLFATIPILVVIFLLVLWWKKRTQKKFASANLLVKLAPNYSMFKSVLKLIFFSLGLSFLILALVNPKIGTKLKKHCEKKLKEAQDRIEKIEVGDDGEITTSPIEVSKE